MRKGNQKKLLTAIYMLVLFVLWTVAVKFIDVKAIGPMGSSVGFATVNGFFHHLTDVHMSMYTITDWLGLVPFAFMGGFAVFGLVQLIKRKNLLKVDYSILVLGGFYVLVFAAYILFEIFVVNYRPVLIDGVLEASYPSSTTMLVMCVMPTALMQFNSRIKNHFAGKILALVISSFTVFMVGGRLVSGVHWISDIIGGALLSVGLVELYSFTCGLKSK